LIICFPLLMHVFLGHYPSFIYSRRRVRMWVQTVALNRLFPLSNLGNSFLNFRIMASIFLTQFPSFSLISEWCDYAPWAQF